MILINEANANPGGYTTIDIDPMITGGIERVVQDAVNAFKKFAGELQELSEQVKAGNKVEEAAE